MLQVQLNAEFLRITFPHHFLSDFQVRIITYNGCQGDMAEFNVQLSDQVEVHFAASDSDLELARVIGLRHLESFFT